jgi:hypothetical protein
VPLHFASSATMSSFLRATILQKFRSLRKFLRPKNPDSATPTSRLRSGAPRAPNETFFPLRLCAFAGDIPILLVAALPRYALRDFRGEDLFSLIEAMPQVVLCG